MSCSIDWSAWVTAIATVVSAGFAYFMWRVSQRLYDLQASVEKAKEPMAHFWCNNTNSLTLINIGKESMPIRRLRFLTGLKSPNQNEIKSIFIRLSEQYETNWQGSFTSIFANNTDVILEPNVLYQVSFELGHRQLTVEAMYYDNSFEFAEIDTSNLGGKYILTGQGRKY